MSNDHTEPVYRSYKNLGKLTPRMLPNEIFVYTEIDPETGCWWWNGAKNKRGYGTAKQDGKTVQAHRLTYKLLVENVDDVLVMDHLCRNPSCVNPHHLEPVTHAENIRRGRSANREKTHCNNGHPYDEVNTVVISGRRRCRTCKKANDAKLREKRRSNG